MASPLTCPYCYRKIVERQVMFRCSGINGPRGKCRTAADRVLAAHMGDHDAQYPAFTADGRRLKAVHEECGAETHHRICPHCHSRLPVHFGRSDGKLIALVGAKYSGKTVYMTVLLHELLHGVGERFGTALLAEDEWTQTHFEEDYEKRLYERGELHSPTRTAAARNGGVARPLVFSFSVSPPAGRLRRFGGDRVDRTVLSFFDTAGEDLDNQTSVDQNVRYLSSADGVILLLDPLQMRGARPLVSAGTDLPEPAPAATSPVNVLTRITTLLHQGKETKRGGLIGTPIAVAFSKMDTLWPALAEGSPLRAAPPTTPAFHVPDSLAVHGHVQALVHEWAGRNLDEALRSNYKRYRYFGLSALGQSPQADGAAPRVSKLGVQPWRVEDPLLWLLSEFGTIGRITRETGRG
ncbi:MAG: FIG00667524: hypothetical protein [uncultured Pseudonocardia sp.]|uniref:Uncharacterized protein n=1 Tax=uncultured Pseudonocardia sp. TaxID=211455 RepID=A0A6J4QNJ4_9PSEU|nr:MAG: FIG00667524: hypothetical protein [uncultured Pseudonocardia sp.]